MLVRITQGNDKGAVVERDDATGQSEIDTGFAEAVTMVAGVATPVGEATATLVEDAGVAEDETAAAVAEEPDEDEEDAVDDEDEEDVVDLADYTLPELEDLGDAYGIEAKDIEGTGSSGNVLKSDWVRVLTAKINEDG